MSAVYTIYTSPNHPLLPDQLPTLVVVPHGKPNHILYTYLHTHQNRENYLLTPSEAGDLCVAKLFPPPPHSSRSSSNSHSGSNGPSNNAVRCEASRNLRWSISNTGIQNPVYKALLSQDDQDQPLFQISKPNPNAGWWTLFYFTYAGHLIPPKRVEFGKISKNPQESGGGTRVSITGKSDEEKAVWKTLGESNEDMVEWIVLCVALTVLDDEIISAAEKAGPGLTAGLPLPNPRLPGQQQLPPPQALRPSPAGSPHPYGMPSPTLSSHSSRPMPSPEPPRGPNLQAPTPGAPAHFAPPSSRTRGGPAPPMHSPLLQSPNGLPQQYGAPSSSPNRANGHAQPHPQRPQQVPPGYPSDPRDPRFHQGPPPTGDPRHSPMPIGHPDPRYQPSQQQAHALPPPHAQGPYRQPSPGPGGRQPSSYRPGPPSQQIPAPPPQLQPGGGAGSRLVQQQVDMKRQQYHQQQQAPQQQYSR